MGHEPQEQRLLRQPVWQALSTLRPEVRTAFYLHYAEGYPTKDVATLMDVNHATVRSWLRRARKQLRNELNAQDNESGKAQAAQTTTPHNTQTGKQNRPASGVLIAGDFAFSPTSYVEGRSKS